MLAALEQELAAAGHGKLRLNGWDTNAAGRSVYARAGYVWSSNSRASASCASDCEEEPLPHPADISTRPRPLNYPADSAQWCVALDAD